MTTFGLITEGLTDQIVIENILSGYFDNPDIIVNPLQPERDKDNANKSANYGGWTLVFNYCQSKDFQEAFQFNEYVIIQIDTDVSEEINYDISKRDENGDLPPEKLIEKVKEKFKDLIGKDFYDKYNHKIIFAIAVDSIECWFLPLYYQNNKKKKTTNCLETLNQALGKEKFTIDTNNKNPEYYREISIKYCKHKTLMKFYEGNPSLKIFIQEIEKRNIAIEDND